MKLLLAILTMLLAGAAQAAAPVCYVSGGEPYCDYTGRVQMLYVNASNLVIFYFDTPAAQMNIPGVTVMSACIVNMNSNMDFAKMFYASALAAQAGGKTVQVQMRGNHAGGYPGCDRIWVQG